MSAFRFSDVYGLLGAMLVLILVYLILNNGMMANQLIGTTANSTNTIFKTLQGR